MKGVRPTSSDAFLTALAAARTTSSSWSGSGSRSMMTRSGPGQVLDRRGPGVEGHRGQVGQVDDGGGVLADDVVDSPAAAPALDGDGADPVREVVGGALLPEPLAVDPVGEPLEVEGPAGQVREHDLGHVAVVGEQVALDQAGVGEERLADAGHLDGAPADPQRPVPHEARHVVSLRPVRDRVAGAAQSVSIRRSIGGIRAALLDAPAACAAWVAAAGSANGTTSGSQTVPLGGTREVSR